MFFPSSTDVVVFGAGLAGLSAGYVLTQQGVDTVICEQASSVGGLARTLEWCQFRFDIGGHRFFTKNDEVHQFVLELMKEDLIEVERKSRLLFRGKFVDYPLTFLNVLVSVGFPDCFIIPCSYLAARIQSIISRTKPTSFEEWATRQFGRRLFEIFFKSYTEKVWGIPCSMLSADWAGQRIEGMSLASVIASALFGWSQSDPKSLVPRFYYFNLGFGQIADSLANYIRQSNSILLETRVSQICHDGSVVKQVIFESESGPSAIDASHFISSIPVTELVLGMSPSAPDDVVDAARHLNYRDLVTVHLAIDRQQITPDHWIYISDPGIKAARIHEPKNWSSAMAPEGKTSLVVEYFCSPTDTIWNRSDEYLIDLTLHDLSETLRLFDREEVLSGFVSRHLRAYPTYEIGYKRHLDKVHHYLHGFANLQAVGRCGSFRYDNSDHAIESGTKAALNILGADFDLDQINSGGEYLEAK